MRSLYAVGPDEFMDTRAQLVAEAKAVGDKDAAAEIGKLRKPSLAAWAVNLIARQDVDVVAELVDVGEQLRAAQSRLDATALTGMRKDRHAAVDAFVAAATAAVDAAGRRLSPAAQQDVRATAIAALADEQASLAVSSGQLTRALSYSGFGEVDLAEAVARTTGGAILTVVPGGATRTAGGGGDQHGEPSPAPAGAAVSRDELERALGSAEKQLASAVQAVDTAREHAEETRERLAVVERQLAKAREADERALEAVTDAVRARKVAEAARDEAARALADAREES
jgi:hypothetical protein